MSDRLVMALIDEETGKKTLFDGENMKFSFGLSKCEVGAKR